MFTSKVATVSMIVLSSFIMVLGQSLNITGTIIDSLTSLPLANAVVSLVSSPSVHDTTDCNGTFVLSGTAGVVAAVSGSRKENSVDLHGDKLMILNGNSSDATDVAVYNAAGALVYHASRSGQDLTFDGLWKTPGLYSVKIRNGRNDQVFTCLENGDRSPSLMPAAGSAQARLAKSSAAYSVVIAKPGYALKQISASGESANMGQVRLTSVAPTVPVVSMPIISQGVPVFASANQSSAAAANDTNASQTWNSNTASGWLAYDLSSKPVSARQNVLVVWYDAQTDYFFYNGTGEPKDYTIEINNAPGGTCPTSGWVAVVSVTGNALSSRLHEVHMAGANWIRINVSACYTSDITIDMDIYDVSRGVTDAWLIMGDSNTQMSLSRWGTDLPNRVNAITQDAWPVIIGAGQGGTSSTQGLLLIDSVIDNFPGKFIALNYGTNDDSTGYFNRMDTLIEKVISAGRVPVVPTIPWRGPGADSITPAKNADIQMLYKKYPQIFPGPDQWTLSYNRADLLPSLHWSAAGQDSVRQHWASVMASSIK